MTETLTTDYRKLAQYYREFGFNLAPLGGDKRPVITGVWKGAPTRFQWQAWTDTKQDDRLWAQIAREKFWADVGGLGCICGPVSGGALCVDFDTDDGGDLVGEFLRKAGLPNDYKWVVKTGTPGRFHIWLRCLDWSGDSGKALAPARGGGGHIELRYTGHYAALPGSLHPSGNIYQFVDGQPTEPPEIMPYADLVAAWQAVTEDEKERPPSPPPGRTNGAGGGYGQAALRDELDALYRARPGARNETLNRAAFALGQLVAGGELAQSVVEDELTRAGLAIGLGEHENRATIKSGLEAGLKKPRTAPTGTGQSTHTGKKDTAPVGGGSRGRKPPARDMLVDIGEAILGLFLDPSGTPYATLEREGHRETHRLFSKPVRVYLSELFHQVGGGWPGSQALQDALNVLEGKAMRAPRQDVYLRTAHEGGVTWIDLGGPDWRAVRVDAEGWEVVAQPPVHFRRTPNMLTMPLPQRGGTLDHLGRLLHVDRHGLVMIAAWAIAALSGLGPFPVLVLVGEQGSAKSTTVRLLKNLLDPAAGGLRGQQRDVHELMVAAHNAWILAYDNISTISADLSDALCRIATGGGYTKRALYTDMEEVILDVMRPVALNGITDIVNRPDLMDRSIVVELPPLPEEKRMDEATYWRRVEEAAPLVLGFLLDALSYALGALPYTKLESSPRMADFARLAGAAAPMLGLKAGEFVRLYQTNREDSTATLVEGTILAEPLRQLVVIDGKWEGKTTDLLRALNKIADEGAKGSKGWPQTPTKLSAELRRIAPALRAAGIVDLRKKRVRGTPTWTVTRLTGQG